MKLNIEGIKDNIPWEKAGIKLPDFDIKAMIERTVKDPKWVHFGSGNIFRAFLAPLQQDLLEQKAVDTGITAVAGFDLEIIDALYKPCDNLTLLVTLKSDGTTEKSVIASVAQALKADCSSPDFARLQGVFCNPCLQMASFTITEKTYSLTTPSGGIIPSAEEDFKNGPSAPVNYMGKVAALMYSRYRAGAFPVSLVSMDNCSHNGDKLKDSILAFARKWHENGFTDSGFISYLEDPSRVGFPCTMIDKITPQPDDSVKKMLAADGLEGAEGFLSSKGSLLAPFVNAEETQYLVIEDIFPNGRAPLEKAGVIFTNRETVDLVERMKVCTCLNPLHTALAIFGCLLGYTRISEEMKNPDLVKLIKGIGYAEGLPAASDPGIISPEKFINEVINIRLPNPFMPDAPQRIATDSSLKIPIRYGETIKAYMAGATLKTGDLKFIPLVLAAWLRYILGIDDTGKSFTVSPDPNYESVFAQIKGISLGQKGPFHETLKPILSNPNYFAVDLYKAGLGEKVESFFAELLSGPGAVAAVLKKYTG